MAMTRILVVLLLLLVAGLLARRAFVRFLGSPRGRELQAVWRILRQLGAQRGGAPPFVAPGSPRDRASPAGGAATATRSERDASSTRLVRCRACGTHVPEDRARRSSNGQVFCSETCERRAATS
jgi:hypothetical protein